MTRFARFAALAVVAALSSPAVAGDYRAGGVEVRGPWTRPAAAGMNGVGYFTLANVGTKPVKLLAVESPAAKMVSLHQSALANGVSSMRPVTGGVVIAPGREIAFAPGGYHLMLMGLTRPQALGGKVPATLVFEGGRRLAIELAVEAGGSKPAMAPMAGMNH